MTTEPDETTMRIFKRDAIIMKQMQSLMDLHNKGMTQAEMIHAMFDFLAKRQDDFFSQIEKHRQMNDNLMEEWTRIMLKRMREV